MNEGKYKLYGAVLTIETGRLQFAGGPVDDPLLNVRAFRKSGDVTAGAYVTGTLKNPRIALYSDPAMDQSEILSYLITGGSLKNASPAQGNMLYSATRTLSLSGGEILAKKIGGYFGLQDVSVEKGTKAGEESLVVGKYLSPKLYISYGIGIFETVSTVKVKYFVNKKLIIQLESGIDKGADLIYTLEK